MEYKKIMQSALLFYVKETKKNQLNIELILREAPFLRNYSNLLESDSDMKMFQELFGFGKKQMSNLLPDEKQVIDLLRKKLSTAHSNIENLSKISIKDPTETGLALNRMVDIIKNIKELSDDFESIRIENSKNPDVTKELESFVSEIYPAKMKVFGMIAFKLNELKKDSEKAYAALEKIIPKEQLNYALSSAEKEYTPSLPMRSLSDLFTQKDLPTGKIGRSVPVGGITEEEEVKKLS